MEALRPDETICCKTLWISDVHLGNIHSKADYLLETLHRVECEQVYLVGDILDMWSMSRRVHWPESHNEVLRKLLKMSRQGVKITYIPGNHDKNMRDFAGSTFGNVVIKLQAEHHSSDGRRFLVIHGDELDFATRYSRLSRWVGDAAYSLLMAANRIFNQVRTFTGRPYWSLAGWLKSHIAQAEQAIAAYERAASIMAMEGGFDGIICGHLHHPVIRDCEGVLYCNDGDWVENCTALIEDFQGELHLLQAVGMSSSPQQMILTASKA